MAETVNESLLDQTISHQVGLQRYTSATVRKIVALLNRVDGDIVAQIAKIDPTAVAGSYSQKRLEKLLEAVGALSDEATRAATRELDSELRALAAYEAAYQTAMIAASVPVRLDIVTPGDTQLYAAVNSRPFQGRLLKDWYSGFQESAKRRVRESIRQGFTEGETIDQMVRRVRGTAAAQYRDGALEITRRGAEALVRTAVNHTANTSRSELYRQNDDLVKGVQWVATLDSRTTLVCASRDGKIYPPDSGPRPPAHINCRSTTVPVLKSWKELGINLSEAPEGTRASMDGQVPADKTYDSWLRGKDKAFQEEVLGATKARLFRDGDLTLDRFVDRAGNELTLDQLRKREMAAFEKAGVS